MTQSELPPSMLCEAAVLLHEEEEEEGGRFKSQRGFFFHSGREEGRGGGGIGEGEYSWRVWKKKKKGAGRWREHVIGCHSPPPHTSQQAFQPANQELLLCLKDAREKKRRRRSLKKKDKCAAGVDVQRLQFVKTETCFLNLVFFHSGSALRVYPAAGSWLMRLHHMVASLPHMGGTAPDSSEHLPVLFELLNKVYSAVNVCTERGVSERGDLSPCEPWVLVNHVIN